MIPLCAAVSLFSTLQLVAPVATTANWVSTSPGSPEPTSEVPASEVNRRETPITGIPSDPGPLPRRLDVELSTRQSSTPTRHPGYGSIGRSRLHILLGTRTMTDPAWGVLDSQTMVGLDFSHHPEGFLVAMDIALLYARDSATIAGSSVTAEEVEFSLGFSKTFFERSRFQPYVGLGGSLLYAEWAGSPGGVGLQRQTGTTFGGYGKLGLLFKIQSYQHLGIEYRGLRGTSLTSGTTSFDADYDQFAFVFGAVF